MNSLRRRRGCDVYHVQDTKRLTAFTTATFHTTGPPAGADNGLKNLSYEAAETLLMNTKTQGGFTLIELVVVIVILGILAAFAVPRFMGLETEARIAAVRSMAGTLRSTAAMGHGVCMARGCPNAANNIPIEGINIGFLNTYPNQASIDDLIQNLDGFTNATPGAGQRRFTKTGARVPAQCWVQYNEATINGAGAVIPPTITYPIAGNEVAINNHLRTNC